MTGYVVHYSDGTTDRMKSVAASSTSTDITGLTSGLTYTISVEATSQHLSGESEERTIRLGEWNTMNITLCTIYGVGECILIMHMCMLDVCTDVLGLWYCNALSTSILYHIQSIH